MMIFQQMRLSSLIMFSNGKSNKSRVLEMTWMSKNQEAITEAVKELVRNEEEDILDERWWQIFQRSLTHHSMIFHDYDVEIRSPIMKFSKLEDNHHSFKVFKEEHFIRTSKTPLIYTKYGKELSLQLRLKVTRNLLIHESYHSNPDLNPQWDIITQISWKQKICQVISRITNRNCWPKQ